MSATDTRTDLGAFVCVIEELHRDLATADAACVGRFTHAEVTLDLGTSPDWIGGGLADDEEWRIEWVKLYEGLDLAHGFVTTGDPRYLSTWEDLTTSFCVQVPVGHDTSDVSARRLQNWLYAWQRFASSTSFEGFRPGVADRLRRRILDDVEHLATHLTAERNHRTMELYTLLLVGLAFGEAPLAADALGLLAENAALDIVDDGVHRERSSDYHMIVLRSLVGAVANARLAGLDVDDRLLAATDRAATFGLHLQCPDGTTPALSDGDQADFRSLLSFASRVLGRPDLEWAATLGGRGVPPKDTAATFPTGGYVVQRSGWGDGSTPYGDERWAILDCGPLGDGGHGHYDHLSVELAGGGHRIAVDPGRFTYADGPDGWRRWFKGTQAHNTVCVDGLDQTPYRRGKPKGPTSSAHLVRRHTEHGLDIVVARATSPQYRAVHERTLAFVGGEYWIVIDELADDEPHDYVARWHLDPSTQGAVTVRAAEAGSIVETPAATFVVLRDSGLVDIEDGWVSPTYGERLPAPVIAIAAPRHHTATIVTLIDPLCRSPRSVIHEVDGDHHAVQIDWGGSRDDLAWQPSSANWSRT
ncbi:MAG: alginate lyase family protein [Acidimicrobiales bacterium]